MMPTCSRSSTPFNFPGWVFNCSNLSSAKLTSPARSSMRRPKNSVRAEPVAGHWAESNTAKVPSARATAATSYGWSRPTTMYPWLARSSAYDA